MTGQDKKVTAEEARTAIEAISRRVGLLHLCYARTLVKELGKERGRELIEEAIWDYGTEVGKATRRRVLEKGLEPTPQNMAAGSDLSPLGFDHRSAMVDGEPRIHSMACALADVWREFGEEDLGQLYCLVDPAKMQAYAPELTLVHTQRIPLGDECCELAVRPTSSQRDSQIDLDEEGTDV